MHVEEVTSNTSKVTGEHNQSHANLSEERITNTVAITKLWVIQRQKYSICESSDILSPHKISASFQE